MRSAVAARALPFDLATHFDDVTRRVIATVAPRDVRRL
jgi:hypothetical protein